jgi:hypothetical protein
MILENIGPYMAHYWLKAMAASVGMSEARLLLRRLDMAKPRERETMLERLRIKNPDPGFFDQAGGAHAKKYARSASRDVAMAA